MGLINIFGRNKPKYHLENVIEKNIEFPRTFESSLNNGCSAERMCVKITNISFSNNFTWL